MQTQCKLFSFNRLGIMKNGVLRTQMYEKEELVVWTIHSFLVWCVLCTRFFTRFTLKPTYLSTCCFLDLSEVATLPPKSALP